MILNRIIDAKYTKFEYNLTLLFIFFTYLAAILNISNWSKGATCHPPGIVHWDPIDEKSKEKKLYHSILG